MTAAKVSPALVDPSTMDHFVYRNPATFRDYEALLEQRGDSSVPRITYLEGVLELMTPSRYHEGDKKKLARLLEAWAEEKGVMFEGFGSWTLKNREKQRGAEPDECYTVGRRAETEEDRPDIAIEVIWTSGGIDKLEVYRQLNVREVWIYERGTLQFFSLRGEQYAPIARSEFLPDLDVALILQCMTEPTQGGAVKALRAALRR